MNIQKKRITYGVNGLMEYQAIIRMGRSQLKVRFSDGSATGYGTNPAMYTTDSAMIQNAIENSEQYKRGRIYIVNSVDLEAEEKVLSNRENTVETGDSSDGIEGCHPEGDAADLERTEDAEDAEDTEEMPLELEFDNNDDAKDYLEREFGCQRSKLHNRSDIISAGQAYGVNISFS